MSAAWVACRALCLLWAWGCWGSRRITHGNNWKIDRALETQGPSTMLRLALSGCQSGIVARYARLAPRVPGATFAGVVDDDDERLQHAAQVLNATLIARSLAELLEQPSHDFDAVLIHSPLPVHAEQVKSAADAKKHLFVEAPYSTSVTQAVEMI